MNQQSEMLAGLVISEATGQVHVVDPNLPELAVDLTASSIHRQNALFYLEKMHAAKHFITRDDFDLAKSGSTHAPQSVRERRQQEMKRYRDLAEVEFIESTGNLAVAAAGHWDEKQLSLENKKEFNGQFMRKYGQARRDTSRRNEIARLRDDIEFMQTSSDLRQLIEVSLENKAENQKNGSNGSHAHLDDPTKLRVISGDPRTEYLPTHNREKTTVLTFLDYLDNPAYPLSVRDQLLEVFGKLRYLAKEDSDIDPFRGPLSITFELIDYFKNAQNSLNALIAVRPSIKELPNRAVTLGDEAEWLDLNKAGFRALIRYIDISKYMKTGKKTQIGSPLRTTPDRWEKSPTGDDPHKVVEDFYTGSPKQKTKQRYVEQLLNNQNVGEAQDNIDVAIIDQSNRLRFLTLCLTEIATYPSDAHMYQAEKRRLLKAKNAAMTALGLAA